MEANYKVESAIEDAATESAEWALAYATLRVATELSNLSTQVKYLGNGNAATPMGAIEAFSVVMKDGFRELSDVIGQASNDLSASIGDVGVAMVEKNE